VDPWSLGGIIYIKIVQVMGQDGTLCTPTCTSLGMDNSPSTETLTFLLVRNELIHFINFTEKCNFCSLYSKPRCHVVSKSFFDIQEYRSTKHIVKVKGHVIRKSHILKCHAVTCTKAKLTSI